MSKNMSKNDVTDIKSHVKVYMLVFAALAVLTIVTVSVSYLDLSTSEAVFLALIIASIKGSLVASYFMHLISEKALISWILILTAVFFFTLMFLPILSFYDWVD
ncbi:MAG: cytochrome C oxidase subunit IV family protein [Candidatus Marinimicrobia bacterium]|jgi:cytochrome c oxidase subunit 4|nr:cytochrome C oxidase subunit IV family protein [Candidatus Neomarinimicrobiota bacterium]MDP7331048.1 cytochrome C oxidase subunit IV family protein [Candidatus Neomarinimicrobiota bacterium]HJL62977.1 cytochrome C oxidase subunit IV family protein [Candidatus Neomarinimicrobiota bacterium]|tara:strand:+ start:3284 stop:3595 length:312 start_codon:yes stop_codon:yes gene_type:complete